MKGCASTSRPGLDLRFAYEGTSYSISISISLPIPTPSRFICPNANANALLVLRTVPSMITARCDGVDTGWKPTNKRTQSLCSLLSACGSSRAGKSAAFAAAPVCAQSTVYSTFVPCSYLAYNHFRRHDSQSSARRVPQHGRRSEGGVWVLGVGDGDGDGDGESP